MHNVTCNLCQNYFFNQPCWLPCHACKWVPLHTFWVCFTAAVELIRTKYTQKSCKKRDLFRWWEGQTCTVNAASGLMCVPRATCGVAVSRISTSSYVATDMASLVHVSKLGMSYCVKDGPFCSRFVIGWQPCTRRVCRICVSGASTGTYEGRS